MTSSAFTAFSLDEAGFPVILTEPAEAAVTAKTKAKAEVPPKNQAVEQDEMHRRADAVRDAAREFETFTTQDLREWVKGRTNRTLTDDELAQFEADVRAHQHADLADILDQMTIGNSRGRRQVKVKAPRGYLRKTLGALTDDELKALEARLRGRGWTDQNVKQGLVSRLPVNRQGALAAPAATS